MVESVRLINPEIGDNLSAIKAPETTAPNSTGVGIPKPLPIPNNAMPIVLTVPTAVPIKTELIDIIKNAANTKFISFKYSKP